MYRLSETGFGLITAAAEERGYWRMRPAAARAASPTALRLRGGGGHHLFSDTISYFFGYMISDIRGHSFSDMHFSDIQFSDMIYSFFGYVKHSF